MSAQPSLADARLVLAWSWATPHLGGQLAIGVALLARASTLAPPLVECFAGRPPARPPVARSRG